MGKIFICTTFQSPHLMQSPTKRPKTFELRHHTYEFIIQQVFDQKLVLLKFNVDIS